MLSSITEQTNTSPQQHWFAQVSVYLHDQLRKVFDNCELVLLREGEQAALCCDLRRARRAFVDHYLNQLHIRCRNPVNSVDGIVSNGSATSVRTLIHLTDANGVLRALFQAQAIAIGRLVAAWIQQTGFSNTIFDCPVSPHSLARYFFLALPELPVPLRIRHRLAQVFLDDFPRFSGALLDAVFTQMERRGTRQTALVPLPLPEWWEPLEKTRSPSAAALALVVPPRFVEKAVGLAQKTASAALVQDEASVLSLLESQRSTILLSWLLERLRDQGGHIPPAGRAVLCLLSGPLLLAACQESFADAAHPARRVLDAWCHWAPGWQESLGIEGVVPERCRELANELAAVVAQGQREQMVNWLPLLDYLLQLRQRVQQDLSVVVASTRLSLQVLETRTEVDTWLAERAGSASWPPVLVEILGEDWSALMSGIHWRDGSACDDWLKAIAVVDDLLASVQQGISHQERQRLMRGMPALLQHLRKGFETLGCDRKRYSELLSRLQAVHMVLLKGGDVEQLSEPLEPWPRVKPQPVSGDPFEVGTWLRQADGRVLSVEFSDGWCTALCDTHSAALESCATMALQAEFEEGNLEILPTPVVGLVSASTV